AGRMSQLKRHVASLPKQEELRKFWPGPYTLLLKASRFAPKWIIGKHDKIAVRLTAHPDASRLCNSLGMALVSTSANVSGMKPAKTYRDCLSRFGSRVLAIPGKVGKRKIPSTIMDFESGKIFRP
ncbi:MAG: L-threonylcarbamoyladenylate synthase, partial [Burkholderiales bacterium]